MNPTKAQLRTFRDKVWDYYRSHGRDFPWRNPSDPYDILVSEVMLQQTQADRVVPKYLAFMDRFPTIETLASASQAEVLRLWQGLGYNRRALNLWRAAQLVRDELGGQLPDDESELAKLPGIGPYTAAAVAAFAGNRPSIVIETNIRAVFIHEFFGDREGITDKEILPLVELTVDKENPRQWYAALMDYGAMLKKTGINPSRRSRHYVRQAAFKGSNRQIRGAALRAIATGQRFDSQVLAADLSVDRARIEAALEQLQAEGFIAKKRGRYALA